MLVSSEKVFNQADFDRRLRHYFSDSAPCVIRYVLYLDHVEVFNEDKGIEQGVKITVHLNTDRSEEENARIVIEKCEDLLYPHLTRVVEETVPLPADEVAALINKGKTLVEIMEMASSHKKKQKLTIVRIGLNNNTVVIRDDRTGTKIIYSLNFMPVLGFLEMLRDGKHTAESGYKYLIENSKALSEGV